MLEAGAAELLLSTGSHLGGKPQFTGTLYFHISGVQEFFERVKNQVEVVWPLETMDYGQKEFGVRDGDGYVLAFAEFLEADEGDGDDDSVPEDDPHPAYLQRGESQGVLR
jgi:hypothetical protein